MMARFLRAELCGNNEVWQTKTKYCQCVKSGGEDFFFFYPILIVAQSTGFVLRQLFYCLDNRRCHFSSADTFLRRCANVCTSESISKHFLNCIFNRLGSFLYFERVTKHKCCRTNRCQRISNIFPGDFRS